MLVLGVNPAENSAAAVVIDGTLAFAAEEERFVGRKHVQGVPYRAIEAGLRHVGARLRDVDRIAVGWCPAAGLPRRALGALRMMGTRSSSGVMRRGGGYARLIGDALFIRSRLQTAWPGEPIRARVSHWPHHRAHAASALAWSGEEESAILTVDGVGEDETVVLWHARDRRFTALERVTFPNSLGHLYSVFTSYLGFDMGDGEGKTMGLSSYGEPRFLEPMRRWTSACDGSFALDVRRINYGGARARAFHPDLVRTLGPPVERASERDPRHCDIAASVQAVVEEHVGALVRRLAARVPSRALALCGGVALNCAGNGRLFDLGLFDRIHVCPAPTDAGTAMGAALLEAESAGDHPRIGEAVFLGPRDPRRLPREIDGLVVSDTGAPAEAIADLLGRGLVVAVFRDRMEFGPRALGNRSILASAQPRAMKDHVNDRIKFREPFRPFAPAVLAEEADSYFEAPGASPFMTFAFRARAAARDRLPATVHVDGTGRLQTVDRERYPFFHDVLSAYRRRTGCAGLLNTSLNVRGRPIAATKSDALRMLLETGLDALVADGQVLVKHEVAERAGRWHAAVGSAAAAG